MIDFATIIPFVILMIVSFFLSQGRSVSIEFVSAAMGFLVASTLVFKKSDFGVLYHLGAEDPISLASNYIITMVFIFMTVSLLVILMYKQFESFYDAQVIGKSLSAKNIVAAGLSFVSSTVLSFMLFVGCVSAAQKQGEIVTLVMRNDIGSLFIILAVMFNPDWMNAWVYIVVFGLACMLFWIHIRAANEKFEEIKRNFLREQ